MVTAAEQFNTEVWREKLENRIAPPSACQHSPRPLRSSAASVVQKSVESVDPFVSLCRGGEKTRCLLWLRCPAPTSNIATSTSAFGGSGGYSTGNNSIAFNLGSGTAANGADSGLAGLGSYFGNMSLSQLTNPQLAVSSDGQLFNSTPAQVLGLGTSYSLAVQVGVHNQAVTAALQNPGTGDFSNDPYGFRYVNLSQSQQAGSGAYLAAGLMVGGGSLTAGSAALGAIYGGTIATYGAVQGSTSAVNAYNSFQSGNPAAGVADAALAALDFGGAGFAATAEIRPAWAGYVGNSGNLVDSSAVAAENITAVPYGDLSGTLPEGFQANHLNQNAAFELDQAGNEVIPQEEGLAIGMQGNAITEPGTPHYNFHQSLEQFWNQYRRSGAFFQLRPTNAEYGQALQQALQSAGYSSSQAADLTAQAAAQRTAYGLGEFDLVPRIPRQINQVQP